MMAEHVDVISDHNLYHCSTRFLQRFMISRADMAHIRTEEGKCKSSHLLRELVRLLTFLNSAERI